MEVVRKCLLLEAGLIDDAALDLGRIDCARKRKRLYRVSLYYKPGVLPGKFFIRRHQYERVGGTGV